MSDLRFELDWISYADGDWIENSDTTAHLKIFADSLCLTRNENAWSEKIEDSVAVSLYPLAEWLATSWWRLNYEPLPDTAKVPHNWRMAHEMAAANAGFVWPTVAFATDGEAMQIWANSSAASERTSAKYVVGTRGPVFVSTGKFQTTVADFIERVLERLSECRKTNSELAELWQLVQSDMADETMAELRRLEARMGYDPEECPEELLKHALGLENCLGADALAELAPAYAGRDSDADVEGMSELIKAKGLSGKPEIPESDFSHALGETIPWKRAGIAARQLRRTLGMDSKPIVDSDLYGLLGLTKREVEEWRPTGKARAAVAERKTDGSMDYVSRKKHPLGKRFEFARFIADEVGRRNTTDQTYWLAATDLSTSRQKFQRAFAAEFLCPVDSLVDFMEDDFSETSIEDAANHFSVSGRTVESLLKNSGHIEPIYAVEGMPYGF